MSQLKSILLMLFMVIIVTDPLPLKAANILPNKIHRATLDNGLQVFTVPSESPGVAAFYLVVRTGSRNEVEKGVTGFAHFFEHMMFQGTEKFPKDKYNALLKSIGASNNANTSNDRTEYHITGNAAKLELMFELEADRFQNLKYSVHDFKTEAGAVKGEYTKNFANPYQQLDEGMRSAAFEKHTYKHTTMGFFNDIVDMPNQYDYSIQFFNRYYRPEYTSILVVGDVTPDQVNGLAIKYFGDWQRGTYISVVPEESVQKEARYYHLQFSGIPPYLSLNFKGPAFNDQEIDMPALNIAARIIFSENSKLYKKLVIEEQKARSLTCDPIDSRDPYLFTITASLYNKSDMQDVKDQIVNAIDEFINIEVDQKLLADTKSNLKYSLAMQMDSPGAIAGILSDYISLTGDPEGVNRLYELYQTITADQIKTIVKKYLIPGGLTIATISGDAAGGVK